MTEPQPETVGVSGATATAILEAVAAVAQSLLATRTWQEAMPGAMQLLGSAARVSRTHVFRNHRIEGRLLASQMFEWCAPGIPPVIDDPRFQEYDYVEVGYERWIKLMENGEAIYGTVDQFPPEEQGELREEGIVSTLSVPIFAGDEWWGTIGFDDCEHERAWAHGEVEALRSAAGIIGASILRQRLENQFRALVEDGPLITYQETTHSGRQGIELIYLSPQAETVLGYPAELWQDSAFWPSIVHPEDRAEVLDEDEETMAAGESFDMDYRIVAADGRTVWVNDQSYLVADEAGSDAYWQGFILDITARKEAEQRLAEAEERYRFLVERGPLATYLLEFPQYPELHPVYLSPQFETMLGYPLERWNVSAFWDSVVHPDDLEALHAEDQRAMAEGTFDIEYRMIAADGRIVWVHDTAEVVDDDGTQMWKGYLVDVTQRHMALEEREAALEQERSAKQRVEEISGLKDVMLQAVAHDIRTPLTAILGMATTLAQPDVELTEDERREFGQRIAVNTTRLDRLVSDLLDLDRFSRGEMHTNLLTVDLGAIARDVADFADAQGRELTIEAQPTIVQADPAKVERIIDNLLGNAAKHTPRGAHIWLRVDPTDGGGLITVDDDGPGVPAADRERIFDIYRRGGAAPGSGVGLSLVQRFAEIHGGRAWVAERPGGGASFRVWLPAAPVPWATEEPE